MPLQKGPAIIQTNQKPVNVFYVWYAELCRRLNSTPAPVVRPAKPKCQTVLDFVADRLKMEEWNPVINALRHDTSLHVIAIKSRLGNCPFLHEVDTEEKLRQLKRRSGSLWTAFILKSLLKSLSCTIRNTQVLTCLEFDGLPMFAQYLEPLMKALQKNKTLKSLSLSRCRICDAGCEMVCAYLKLAPNIEVLNLSGCGLTPASGQHIAKLIKYQQINRYCESWHNSLRYSDPNIQVMRGIKRITINSNPCIGDEGLDFILNELDDDLWIKALDMQKCGITENMTMRIIDVVEYSQSLEIVDFRLNDQLSLATLERIFSILKQKQLNNSQPEFQWCNTSFTLTSIYDTISTCAAPTPAPHKVKSAPLKNVTSSRVTAVRRAKTSDNIPNKNIERKVSELSNLLQEEITRRKETEKDNEDLRRKLEEMNKKPKNSNGVKKKNGYNGFKVEACSILEKLVNGGGGDDSLDEESLLDYVEDESKSKADGGMLMNGYSMTDSQISLFKFMESLKNNNNTVTSQVKFMNRPNTTKYYITDKHVKKKETKRPNSNSNNNDNDQVNKINK